MSAADRFLGEAQLRAKYGDAEYEKRRALGVFGVAVPQENYSMPGAPAGFIEPASAREAMELVQELEDAQQPQNPGRRAQFSTRVGPDGQISYARLYAGRPGSYRGLDLQAQEQAELREMNRQAFLQAGRGRWDLAPEGLDAVFGAGAPRPANAQEALQRLTGIEAGADAAFRAQQYAEILNLGPRAAYQLVLAENGLAELPESLVRKVASTGEIAPDPVATALASGLSREALRQRTLQRDEAGFGEADDNRVPILSDAALQSVADRVSRSITGMPSTPFRQLTAEETAAAAEAEGAGKTRGGRRNSLRKNSNFPEEAAVVRVPGSVLSQGIEPNPANFLMPVLVAPKNQQVWSEGAADLRGDERVMQVAQYNAGKDAQGRTMWRPSLRNARVVYVNPYGEVPDAVMSRLGLDMVPYLPEKDVSGAMDQKALNVPIPDIDGQGGFRSPSDDPGYGMRGETQYRKPTIAEAVQSLLLQNSTPIKPYTEEMLVGRGARYGDAVLKPDGSEVPVYALGSKRSKDGKARPISAYFETPAEPGAPRVADVRVGTANRYTPEFYEAFDELIGALATEAYGQNVPVAAELAGRDRFQPNRGVIPPEKVRYGALMNLAGNADIQAAAAYQRALLEEAGFPVSGRTRNPLMEMVGIMKDLGAAPPSDVPVRNAALTAAQAEPIVAPRGLTGASRLLQQVRQEKLATMGAQGPTTSRARQTDENAAYSLLNRLLGGAAVPQPRDEQMPRYGVYRDDLSIRQPGYRQSVISGLEQELRFPQTTPPDPVARDVLRYMRERVPASSAAEPQRVIQFVPRELMDPQAVQIRQEVTAGTGGAPARPVAVAQGGLSLGDTSASPAASYVDAVDRYMRRFPPRVEPAAQSATDRAVQLELLRRGRDGNYGRIPSMRVGR